MIADIISNKKLSPRITEQKKLNISTVFITHYYFQVLKDVRLNCTQFFIMKIPDKRQI